MKMKVFVEIIGRIAEGKNISEWIHLSDGASLKDLLETLKNRIKINFNKTAITILLNGRQVDYHEALNIKIKELDRVIITSPVAGG
ncbi:MAG: MoaD/ThiS family protein [Candidatus Bathyarchaeia archaeon]